VKYVSIWSKGKKLKVKYDACDAKLIKSMRWHIHFAGGYAATNRARKTFLMHRLILNAPPTSHIDHINGDPLDNRRSNLRFCNRSENICNRKLNKNNTTGCKGVYRRKKGWSVTIQKANIQIHIGHYTTKHDAMIAYDAAAVALHKQFARLNREM